MSKHDFSAAEFAERRNRLQTAMADAGIDWLVAVHPVSIHWLTGSDAKSYQEFQCLLIGGAGQPLVMLTRAGETHEFETDSLADEVVGWGGGTVEDPIAAFEALATRLGLREGRVGLEVPAYYLHPQHYLRLRAWLGDALASEATDLVARLRLVRSPAELGYIREATAYADIGMDRFLGALRPGVSELALAGTVYEAIMAAGSGIAASPMTAFRASARPIRTVRRRSACCRQETTAASNMARRADATPRRLGGSSCWVGRRRACSNSTTLSAAPPTR